MSVAGRCLAADGGNSRGLNLAITCGAGAHGQTRTTDSDREALIVVTGDVLTKAQHIQFSSKHAPPPDLTNHFEGLRVRLYGDVGIVNGLVVTTDSQGHKVNKPVFTDVFVYGDGRWQAVNAQENAVRKTDRAQ